MMCVSVDCVILLHFVKRACISSRYDAALVNVYISGNDWIFFTFKSSSIGSGSMRYFKLLISHIITWFSSELCVIFIKKFFFRVFHNWIYFPVSYLQIEINIKWWNIKNLKHSNCKHLSKSNNKNRRFLAMGQFTYIFFRLYIYRRR